MSEAAITPKPSTTTKQAARTNWVDWGRLFPLAVFAIFFFFFMEWLFWVTKPSFMDYLPILTKLGIWLLPGLVITAASLPFLLALFAASFLPGLARFSRVFVGAGALLPAGFLAASGLLLLDNFTYTVFRWGVVSTQGWQRGAYAVLFLAFFAWVYIRILRGLFQRRKNRPGPAFKPRLYAAGGLLILAALLGGSLFLNAESADSLLAVGEPTRRPNILLIGSDGLDASSLSMYGNTPDTTPFLRSFTQDALLALNNFPNANFTSASLVSMFTSKLPTQTRMLYPPDILKGSDAFQHLPGILKQAGYYNAEISVDFYADPSVFNLQDGFVMMNGRSDTIGRLYTFSRSYLPEDAAYFLSMTAKRLTDRLFHIAYFRTMPNPYAEVRQKLSNMTDQDRIGQIVSLFRDIDQPLFVHAHLMETHQNESDLYKLGVANFDEQMRFLITELDLMGRLENTVVVVYTDHGFANVSHVRVPLLFRFPNGENAGQIPSNTQNMDIAPTLLDYIGIQPPEWMNGNSLLAGQPPADRPIFSAAPNFRADEDNLMQLDLSKIEPPFYQFGVIEMVVCQNWYSANTTTLTWEEGIVAGHLNPCPDGELPTTAQAQELLLAQLKEHGFDTTVLEQALAR